MEHSTFNPARLALGACVTLLLLQMVASATAAPPQPWFDASWRYRVELTSEKGEGDVAWVTVALGDRAASDGRDLRLVDADGRSRPFEVLHHDAGFTTTLRFFVEPHKAANTWLYYGNAKAPSSKAFDSRLPAADPALPGALPRPWQAQRGVLLRTYHRKDAPHAEKLETIRQRIAAASQQGAGYRPNGISDGFNPFGQSDNYLSYYEGWLRIETAGEYAFATVSDDGSWVVINDQEVVAWPGAHGIGGGERGEHHGLITLQRGVARVRYYHEEGNGGQMAYLAWRPPGAERVIPIPANQWLSVRSAKVGRHEARQGHVLAVADVTIANTYWIADSQDRQATLVRCVSHSVAREGKIRNVRWTFGDGLSAEANGQGAVEHVFFRLGRPSVTLTVTDEKGRSDSVTMHPRIFQVDVVEQAFAYGDRGTYAKAAADYEVMAMAKEDLRMYAAFWRDLEVAGQEVRAARAFVGRFGDDAGVGELARSAAEAALKPEAYDPKAAAALLTKAMEQADNLRQKVLLMLRLAEVSAWDMGQYQIAATHLTTARQMLARRAHEGAAVLERRAIIGQGDVAMLQGKLDEARKHYQQAQAMLETKEDEPKRLARRGGYPYTIEDLLARDEHAKAIDVLDQWDREFPLEKLDGLTLFLRGKTRFIQHPGEQALQYLTLSIEVAPRGLHVAEAAWLRANCLLALDRPAQALEAFKRVANDFTYTQYAIEAQSKIKLCEAKLKEAG